MTIFLTWHIERLKKRINVFQGWSWKEGYLKIQRLTMINELKKRSAPCACKAGKKRLDGERKGKWICSLELRLVNWEIFIFDHSTFKSHKYSSEHTSRILYVGRYFLNMELWKSLNKYEKSKTGYVKKEKFFRGPGTDILKGWL